MYMPDNRVDWHRVFRDSALNAELAIHVVEYEMTIEGLLPHRVFPIIKSLTFA